VGVKNRIHGRGPARCFDRRPLGKIRFRPHESEALTFEQDGCSVHPVAADQSLSFAVTASWNIGGLPAVWALLRERYPEEALDLDVDLALDLNVDSFGWMEIVVALQDRLDIHLSEADIAGIQTIRAWQSSGDGWQHRGCGRLVPGGDRIELLRRGGGAVERGGLESRVGACQPVRLVLYAPVSAILAAWLVRWFRPLRRGPVPIRVASEAGLPGAEITRPGSDPLPRMRRWRDLSPLRPECLPVVSRFVRRERE
jgi:acyl carrier protein